MADELNGVRKAAVLLLSLSQDEAAEILKRLPAEAVEEVSREIASIGEIAVAKEPDSPFAHVVLCFLTTFGPDLARARRRFSVAHLRDSRRSRRAASSTKKSDSSSPSSAITGTRSK